MHVLQIKTTFTLKLNSQQKMTKLFPKIRIFHSYTVYKYSQELVQAL